MADVKATVVVDLQNLESRVGDSELVLEFDRRENGLNPRTQPLYTESAYFLLFAYNVNNLALKPSAGSAYFIPETGTLETEDIVIFNDSLESRVSKPVQSISSVEWLGANGGAITFSGSTLSITGKGNYVARVTYNSAYSVIKLTPPDLSAYDKDDFVINLSVEGEGVLQ
ncbi:hypothetical protein VpasPP24_68 [Vibrio phage Vpas_PP24]|nr:hypothetical protein VpasPP24_68 [Vibrio phage Vpas_PP24]